MNIDAYKRRLNNTQTIGESLVKDSIQLVDSDFNQLPFIEDVLIDGVEDKAVLKLSSDILKKTIKLRPQREIFKGSYVTIGVDTYIVVKAIPHVVYPKGEIKLCNNTLKWKDTLNEIREYPCVITGNSYDMESESATTKYMVLSEAEQKVIVSYNEDTKTIFPEQRFLFDDSAYEIVGIDKTTDVYRGKGFITLTIKSTSVSESDNNDEGVANDSSNSGWGDW